MFYQSLSMIKHKVGWLVGGIKADCLTRDLGLEVECPPWGSFQGILARIYASFGENQGKLRTAGSQDRPGFEPGTSRLQF